MTPIDAGRLAHRRGDRGPGAQRRREDGGWVRGPHRSDWVNKLSYERPKRAWNGVTGADVAVESPRTNVVALGSGAWVVEHSLAVAAGLDFLVEGRVCESNPIGRGRYTFARLGCGRGGSVPRTAKRPLVPRENPTAATTGGGRLYGERHDQ